MSGRTAEEIHACHKKYSIDNTRNNDPFPEFMLPDKLVYFSKGLDGYDYFFEQAVNLNE